MSNSRFDLNLTAYTVLMSKGRASVQAILLALRGHQGPGWVRHQKTRAAACFHAVSRLEAKATCPPLDWDSVLTPVGWVGEPLTWFAVLSAVDGFTLRVRTNRRDLTHMLMVPICLG